jgi:hypothetical protein
MSARRVDGLRRVCTARQLQYTLAWCPPIIGSFGLGEEGACALPCSVAAAFSLEVRRRGGHHALGQGVQTAATRAPV